MPFDVSHTDTSPYCCPSLRIELCTILHEWIVPNQQPRGFFRVILEVILTSAQSEKPKQPQQGSQQTTPLRWIGLSQNNLCSWEHGITTLSRPVTRGSLMNLGPGTPIADARLAYTWVHSTEQPCQPQKPHSAHHEEGLRLGLCLLTLSTGHNLEWPGKSQ